MWVSLNLNLELELELNLQACNLQKKWTQKLDYFLTYPFHWFLTHTKAIVFLLRCQCNSLKRTRVKTTYKLHSSKSAAEFARVGRNFQGAQIQNAKTTRMKQIQERNVKKWSENVEIVCFFQLFNNLNASYWSHTF